MCVDGESFTVVGADEGSYGDHLPGGYKRLRGRTALSCSIGKTKVTAVIHVFPPSDGMGMGSGYVSIDRLEVDGLPIFGYPQPLDWAIPGSDNALVKIAVSVEDGLPAVEICDTDKCGKESLGADWLLNRTYQQTMASVSASERQQLRQEQRFWLKERDPQCRIATVERHNEPLAFLQCVLSAMDIRASRLDEWQREQKNTR